MWFPNSYQLFVFLPLFGLFVLRFLRGFLLICYNLIGQRRITRVSTFLFLYFLIFDYLQSCFSLLGGFLILLIVPSFINIFLCRFLSKKVFLTLFERIDCRDFYCEVCVLVKHHRASFPMKNSKCLSPFSLIHLDVCAPCFTNNSSSQWFVPFVNYCTQSTQVYVLKSKSKVSTIFPIFYKLIST